MTTCPQCGRVADDEFVCTGCGAFLAAEPEDGSAGDVPVGRVALLVVLVCLLAVGAAAVLLRQGGDKHNADLAAPPTVPLSSVPLGTPTDDSSGLVTRSASHPLTTSSTSAASSSASTSSSARASRTASASSTAATTSVAPPHPSSSRAPSTPASSSQSKSPRPSTSSAPSPPPAAPSVQLAKGATNCGPHCYNLLVTLNNFSSGAHTVTCFASHAGHVSQFGSYSTPSTISSGCSYSHPHDTVWVVVEGHRSNTVAW